MKTSKQKKSPCKVLSLYKPPGKSLTLGNGLQSFYTLRWAFYSGRILLTIVFVGKLINFTQIHLFKTGRIH